MSTTLAPARPEPTPLEVFQAAECTAACLLSAHPAGRCRCRCEGTHHGSLLAALAGHAGSTA